MTEMMTEMMTVMMTDDDYDDDTQCVRPSKGKSDVTRHPKGLT